MKGTSRMMDFLRLVKHGPRLVRSIKQSNKSDISFWWILKDMAICCLRYGVSVSDYVHNELWNSASAERKVICEKLEIKRKKIGTTKERVLSRKMFSCKMDATCLRQNRKGNLEKNSSV